MFPPNDPQASKERPREVPTALPGFRLWPGLLDGAEQAALLAEVRQGLETAPLYRPLTPGGRPFSVRMSNFGALGWVSDRQGYRYQPTHPTTCAPWPAIPVRLLSLWDALTGWPSPPDACLINRYGVGAKLSLHQDKDEADLRAPIVSVSLGLPAVFQFGGLKRSDPLKRLLLEHGDVVVWGGASRLFYHGIQPLKPGVHPLTGEYRYNLTFRQAGNSE
jgi:alkylated DNA repair protein (DNA oxidative demethylase)